MNFKTFLKFSKIQHTQNRLTISYITRNETGLLKTGLRSFTSTSAGEHPSCELCWNNCWMGTIGCCWFGLRI